MSGDYEVGFGRPPKRTRWKKGQSGNRRRRKARRAATPVEFIDKLLLSLIDITENGKARRVTTLEAILLRLWEKDLGGNRRALAVRLKYGELVRQNAETATEITFIDSPYTQDCGHIPSSEADGDDKV
jgi:Family of unknown function (DUF5681)